MPPSRPSCSRNKPRSAGARLGRRERRRRSERSTSPPIDVLPVMRKRLAGDGSNFEVELHLARRRSFERPPQPAGQLGIVGLPDPLAWLEREQVDIAAPEPKLERARLARTGVGIGCVRARGVA